MNNSRRPCIVALWIVGLFGVWGLILALGALDRGETRCPRPPRDAEAVLKGLEKIVSTSDGKPSLFTLYVDRKKAKVLAELPKDFERRNTSSP